MRTNSCRFGARPLSVCLVASGVLACASAASAGIVQVGADYFGAGTTVITFSELPVGTEIPMTIGLAQFTGLDGSIEISPGPVPPSVSGGAYLFSHSVGDEDVIDVSLAASQHAVGAYFDVLGGGSSLGTLQVEFYSKGLLLGSFIATPDVGTSGGFIGAAADSAIIDRVVFRDIDLSAPISFRLDDFQFVPAPAAFLALLGAFAGTRHRRRRASNDE